MFLNFELHPLVRKYTGVDVGPYDQTVVVDEEPHGFLAISLQFGQDIFDIRRDYTGRLS